MRRGMAGLAPSALTSPGRWLQAFLPGLRFDTLSILHQQPPSQAFLQLGMFSPPLFPRHARQPFSSLSSILSPRETLTTVLIFSVPGTVAALQTVSRYLVW